MEMCLHPSTREHPQVNTWKEGKGREGREGKEGRLGTRRWPEMLSQQIPQLTLQGALEPGWPFIRVLN